MGVPGRDRRPQRPEWAARRRAVDAPPRSEAPWRAALVGAAVLVIAFGVWLARSQPREPQLNRDASIRLIAGPRPGACAVALADSAVLGEIRGVLGREGRPLMYRVQMPRATPRAGALRGRAPAHTFPRDVWIRDVRVVRCADTRGRAVFRG